MLSMKVDKNIEQIWRIIKTIEDKANNKKAGFLKESVSFKFLLIIKEIEIKP